MLSDRSPLGASTGTPGRPSLTTTSTGLCLDADINAPILTFWDRWISVRAEALAALFSAALAAYLVYGKAYDAARTGFSMTAAGASVRRPENHENRLKQFDSHVQSQHPMDCAVFQRV